MVSTAGGIVIAIVVLALAAVIGWVIFTQMRARRLGLPPPSLKSYLPWHKEESPYGPPSPARGGIVGWVNDQVRKFKNRNNRSAAGAYEQTGGSGAGARRGFGPLDPDEAWDTRVGQEADGYGYEEQEIGGGRGGLGGSTEYGGSGAGYSMNLAAAPEGHGDDDDDRRGRKGRQGAERNPFDDDAASSLRGVSPRPLDNAGAGDRGRPRGGSGGTSLEERRSVFRENM